MNSRFLLKPDAKLFVMSSLSLSPLIFLRDSSFFSFIKSINKRKVLIRVDGLLARLVDRDLHGVKRGCAKCIRIGTTTNCVNTEG